MNTTGKHLTGIGAAALRNNTIADFNTAIGADAMRENTIGQQNTAVGADALSSNTTGNDNTACGQNALLSNTSGGGNIALGFGAGAALTTGNSNIDIGNAGVAGESDTIRIGGGQTRTFIAAIRDVTTGVADAVNVVIDSNGQLGTMSSSKRFKKDVATMEKASEGILSLRPVTFHYKTDGTSTPQFGLIAEEVAKVNPDLVVRDKEGKPYSVRYDSVNAMLLNEFLKEHRTVQEQQKEIDALKAELKEQKVLIQKVSDKVELNKPAPQMAVNNQ